MHARFRRSIAVWTFVSVASAGFASAQRAPAGALPPQAASLRLTDEMLSGAGASALSWDWAFDGPVAPAPAGPLLFDDALTRSAPAPADDLTRIRAATPTTLTIARDPFQWDGLVDGGSTPGYQVRIDSPALASPLSYDTRPAAWPDAFAAPTPWLQSRRQRRAAKRRDDAGVPRAREQRDGGVAAAISGHVDPRQPRYARGLDPRPDVE